MAYSDSTSQRAQISLLCQIPMSKRSRINSTLAPERYSATELLVRFSSTPKLSPLHFAVDGPLEDETVANDFFSSIGQKRLTCSTVVCLLSPAADIPWRRPWAEMDPQLPLALQNRSKQIANAARSHATRTAAWRLPRGGSGVLEGLARVFSLPALHSFGIRLGHGVRGLPLPVDGISLYEQLCLIAKVATDHAKQLHRAVRFRHVVVAAGGPCFLLIALHGERANSDDRDMCETRIGLDFSGGLIAVHNGHLDIHDDDIGAVGFGAGDASQAICGFDDDVT